MVNECAQYNGYIFYRDGRVFNSRAREIKLRDEVDYFSVSLNNNGKRKYIGFHRIRYYLFVEKFDMEDKNICIVAKDGNYKNIDLDNYVLLKRRQFMKGEAHINSKLTDEDIEDILLKYNMKGIYSYASLAKEYNVSKSLIAQVVTGVRTGYWK